MNKQYLHDPVHYQFAIQQLQGDRRNVAPIVLQYAQIQYDNAHSHDHNVVLIQTSLQCLVHHKAGFREIFQLTMQEELQWEYPISLLDHIDDKPQ